MRAIFYFLPILMPFALYAQSHAQVKILSGENAERWKTVEIGISVPETQRMYREFTADHTRGTNPYTAHNMWMKFICNEQSYVCSAFYMDDCEADLQQNHFIPVESEYPWRVRFVPPEAGDYECVLLIGENEKTAQPQSTGIKFHVNPGQRHGYLNTVSGSPHLQFSDDTPFFILGQNIAWSERTTLNGEQPKGAPFQSGFYDWFHYINNLADNGGNYVRIVMGPWSTGIESKTLGVYEQDKAWALDSIIRLAENRGLYVHLCLDMTTGFDGNPEFHQPVQGAFQKLGMSSAELLHDRGAMKSFDDFVRYVHARWGYSANVAVMEMLGEHPRWTGYEQHKNYFPEFFLHMQSLLRDSLHDDHHMIGTSSSQELLDIFKCPALSFVDVHHYDNDFWCNRKRYFIYHSKAKGYDKPFLFGEMGTIGGPINGCDPDDWDACSDISFHNAIWSTAFIGSMGCGLYWWQWQNDGYREANVKPLHLFIDSIAYDIEYYTKADQWTGHGLEVYYSYGASGTCVGWVHNTSSWWGNLPALNTCHDRNNKQMIHPKDDDKPSAVELRGGRTFVIDHLSPRTRYAIHFYDTRDSLKTIQVIYLRPNKLGKVRIPFPEGTDYAFEIVIPGIVDF